MSLTVAIIGRPNVGKSTLFNRLVGRQLALVDDLPGVTRDRREGEGRIADLEFRLIDTAGLEEAPPDTLAGRMQAQTERSLDLADVALLLIDARAGLTPVDRHFARWLRRTGKPVVLVANKAEGRAALADLDPLWDELFPAEQARIVQLLVERVDVTESGISLRLRTEGLTSLVADLRAAAPRQRAA